MSDTLERDLRLSLAHEQTKHLSPELKLRLAAMLVQSVVDAGGIPSQAHDLVSWASPRLNAAVSELDFEAEQHFDADVADGE